MRPALVAALVGVPAIAVSIWWSVPALAPPPPRPPPILSEARLTELKSSRVGTAYIRGLDVSVSSGDQKLDVVGGYLDERQIVLFIQTDPPARVYQPKLRDQFGRSYDVRSQFADVATGENILYFGQPGLPLTLTGARATLDVYEVERGIAPERMPLRLSAYAILIADQTLAVLGAYLLDMAINYVVMALAGLAYVGLLAGAGRLLDPRRHWAPVRSGATAAVILLVAALPTYVAIAALFRHDPIGPGGLQRQATDYVQIAHAVFVIILGASVAFGALRARNLARGSPSRNRLAAMAAAALLVFVVLIAPMAEFANACFIGAPLILPAQC